MPVATASGIAAPPAADAGKRLTDHQIAVWAAQGGFTGEDRVIAVAVALAESGGEYARVSAPNTDGTHDYGTWQINSVHAHLFTQYPQWWSVSNAKMAKAVYDERKARTGKGWDPWTVYKTGAYLLFMPRARAAVGAAPDSGDVTKQSDGSADPSAVGSTGTAGYSEAFALLDIGNIFRAGFRPLVAASEWMGNADNWVRVAQVVLGVALVVGGITIVARPLVTQVAGPVAGVLTKGKVK